MSEAREIQAAMATATAGHMALALIEQHGRDIGSAMLAGYTRAFVLALAAVEGWEAVDRVLSECAVKRPVQQRSKPQLKIENG